MSDRRRGPVRRGAAVRDEQPRGPHLGPIPITATGILIVVALILSLAYLKRAPKATPSNQMAFPSYDRPQPALPPQRSVPVEMYANPQAGAWRDTNDLQPTSVTESTTRLLKENDR